MSHRTRAVTVVTRSTTGWEEREVRGGEVVQLDAPSLRFSVDELYAGVTLDQR